MIAMRGTIGTGLFLGTGKSLATGGPASVLIAYLIVGGIVFLTMLSLGEMSAFIPVAGSFCTFAGRFVDDAFGFAITWQYWFNDGKTASSWVEYPIARTCEPRSGRGCFWSQGGFSLDNMLTPGNVSSRIIRIR